ncbi:MAG: GAF domain-containing protein [Verrucomicrobiae bacterium]|nr:GAF domain-containing protein [Verrucomicrobiae bacterium]
MPTNEQTEARGKSILHRLAPRLEGWHVLLFIVLPAITTVAAGWIYLKHRRTEAFRVTQEILDSVAESKVEHLASWLKERRRDADLASKTPSIQAFVANPAAPALRAEALKWLEKLRASYGYRTVAILDARGNPMLVAPSQNSHLCSKAAQQVPLVLRTRFVVPQDFHSDSATNSIFFGFLRRIRSEEDARHDRPAQAVLLLHLDPDDFLEPLLMSWPTPSRTAETLFIQREGRQIVFLNRAHPRRGAERMFRLPATGNSQLLEAKALQGETGLLAGVDYRDVPVLATARQIPKTPWTLIAKMDRKEVDATVQREFGLVALMGGLTLTSFALGASLLRRQERWSLVQRELATRRQAEEAIRRMNRTLRALLVCNDLLVRARDESKLLHGICRVICREAGYRMAWVGYAEQNEEKTVRPIAWAGDEQGYLKVANATWSDVERGRRPAGSSIRTGTTTHIQNLEHEARGAPWIEEALKRGFRSSVALPLKDEGGRAFGALVIYAGESNIWPPDEILLLEELAKDLSFGIRTIRARAAHQQAESMLVENEKRLRHLGDNLPDGMIYQLEEKPAGGGLRFVYVSAGVEKMHEIDAGTALKDAQRLFSQVLEEDQPKIAKAETEALAKMTPFRVEVRLRLPSGAVRWRLFAAAPRRTTEGHLLWDGIELDITRLKEIEAELLQAQKMEVVGRLASNVAHDFNNLLMIIKGFSDLGLNALPPGHPVRKNLEEILNAGRRATILTQRLLVFSRRMEIRPRTLNLNLLLGEMEALMRQILGQELQLVFRLDPGLGSVNADPGQIEQVIMNLAINARDAMPKGGTLTVTTFHAELTETDLVGFAERKPGAYAALSLQDTGSGMTEEVMAHLFKPFFTTKEPGKGTGLGLCSVFDIVQQSGGLIRVRSEPGEGSTFTVFLPCLEETTGSSPSPKISART